MRRVLWVMGWMLLTGCEGWEPMDRERYECVGPSAKDLCVERE